ncbi:MAG TPA: anthranilate synthase component I [Solirubrobacteraceae bacterium]|jgi:anthranilate synthase component 1
MPVAPSAPETPIGGTAVQIEPSLEQARALLGSPPAHNLIPLQHSFIADCETPVSAFLKLRSIDPGGLAFLLESAEQGQRMGRYSFIGLHPRSVLRWSLADGGDPYALAAAEVARYRQAPFADGAAGGDGGPPFMGGAVGYFGYDLVRTVEPLGEPNPDQLQLPDMALMLSDLLVVFDHLKHTVTILVNADLDAEPEIERAYASAASTIAEVRARLQGPVPREGRGPGAGDAAEMGTGREMPSFQSNMERSQFEEMVARIVRYIHAGDAFQVVPSQRWSAPVPVQPFSIYRGLRVVNPSPYMYFLDFGDFQVVGASPEPLLTVSGRHVSTRPIAGTRPRGANPEDDRRIAGELLADEKERAEHVMLVDLGRNDLGRVCEYGSVEVEEMMEIELYSHVMHIVSSVSGTLCEGVGAMDALRSVLPAGTLSGAPKVRAMQIIDELEPVKRGGYGGAIGYLSYTGDLDTAIHIRTVVVKDGVAHVQAGGGTVADAKPAYEYEESVAKSRAVMRAIELACEQVDWP